MTLAHNPNDFEIGSRGNLENIIIINKDQTINENTDKYNK
ncbi:MAG: hypothetical protein Q4G04_04805 [bacterium]|nr:hypothetical protein [bacterium]